MSVSKYFDRVRAAEDAVAKADAARREIDDRPDSDPEWQRRNAVVAEALEDRRRAWRGR